MSFMTVEVKNAQGVVLLRYSVRRDGTLDSEFEQIAPSRGERRAVMQALETALVTTGPTSVSVAPECE